MTIDCTSDCAYLVASRQYDFERREIDRAKLPFSDTKIDSAFLAAHESLLLELVYAVCLYARGNFALLDSDVLASLESLAETYRTLSSGIYYEKPPDYRIRRELYNELKAAIEDYRKKEAQKVGVTSLRDGEIRDTLIFLAQLGAMRTNSRPKGRAYLDFLRKPFKPEEFAKPASNIILLS